MFNACGIDTWEGGYELLGYTPFGLEQSAYNAGGKEYSSTWLRLVLLYSFLPALLALLIAKTTADHSITCYILYI